MVLTCINCGNGGETWCNSNTEMVRSCFIMTPEMEGINLCNKKHGNSGEFPNQDMELTVWFYQAKDVCCFSKKHGDWTKTCNRFTNNKRDLTNPKWTGIASQQAENLKESTGLLSSQFRPTQPFQNFKSVLDSSSSNHLQTVFGCPEFRFGGYRRSAYKKSPSPLVVIYCWTSPLSGHGVHRGTRVEQAKASGHRASCCGSKMLSFQWYKVLGSKVLQLSSAFQGSSKTRRSSGLNLPGWINDEDQHMITSEW